MLELSNKTDLAMFQSKLTVYHYRVWHSTFNIHVGNSGLGVGVGGGGHVSFKRYN